MATKGKNRAQARRNKSSRYRAAKKIRAKRKKAKSRHGQRVAR